MTSRYERSKNLGSTGADSAASFATANGGFVTPVNPSPRMKGSESRSDPPEPPGEETGADGQAPLGGIS